MSNPQVPGADANAHKKINYIIQCQEMLSLAVKKSILTLLALEENEKFFLATSGAKDDTKINMDAVLEANPELISSIYNLVEAHMRVLNTPKS